MAELVRVLLDVEQVVPWSCMDPSWIWNQRHYVADAHALLATDGEIGDAALALARRFGQGLLKRHLPTWVAVEQALAAGVADGGAAAALEPLRMLAGGPNGKRRGVTVPLTRESALHVGGPGKHSHAHKLLHLPVYADDKTAHAGLASPSPRMYPPPAYPPSARASADRSLPGATQPGTDVARQVGDTPEDVEGSPLTCAPALPSAQQLSPAARASKRARPKNAEPVRNGKPGSAAQRLRGILSEGAPGKPAEPSDPGSETESEGVSSPTGEMAEAWDLELDYESLPLVVAPVSAAAKVPVFASVPAKPPAVASRAPALLGWHSGGG
ncbi:hypothetical protein T492DRAFT_1138790, partial [Pavlovales sp. CCMP2436]